jgi:hypothetical protein
VFVEKPDPDVLETLIEFAKSRYGEAEVQRLVDLNPYHVFYEVEDNTFRLYRPGLDPTPDCCVNGHCTRLQKWGLPPFLAKKRH